MNPVIAMLIGVVVMMVLVICTRMHAFPSLIISAILIAVLSGNYLLVGTGNEGGNLLSVAISTVTGGFGGTMTSIVSSSASAASWVSFWKKAALPSVWLSPF